MKILFDLTYINPLSISGISIYSLRLLKGLENLDTQHQVILLVTETNNTFFKRKYPGYYTITLQTKDNIVLNKLHFLKGYIYKYSINKIIKKNNISLLFSPYLHMGALFTTTVSQVGVLHDAQSYVFLRNKGIKDLLYRVLTLRLLRRMAHIVTISNYAKSSILKEIPFLSPPISVIYNSVVVSKSAKETSFAKYTPYILFVNTLMPYKNLETLVRAFAILKDTIKHNLIIKANKLPYWDNKIVPLIKEFKLPDRVFLIQDNFSDKKMASLYCEADLFVSPSRMEGFGFTPIEAAMHKVPVISSKETALYETTRGLLNYYEPVNDFNILSKKIYNLIVCKQDKEELMEISNSYKKMYAPLSQAESFIKLFVEIKKKSD